MDSGQTFQFTFTQPGSFPFFCNIHPSMIARITVTGLPGSQPAPTVLAASTLVPTGQPAPTAASTVPPKPEPQPEPTSPAGDTHIVNADMRKFQHQDLTVPEGTTVVWTNLDVVQHTVTSGSPSDPDPGSLFDSGADPADWVVQGETYTLTFSQVGVFPYYCRIHGAPMSGTITVTAAQPGAVTPPSTTAPAATPAPTPTPTAAATPTAEPVAVPRPLRRRWLPPVTRPPMRPYRALRTRT